MKQPVHQNRIGRILRIEAQSAASPPSLRVPPPHKRHTEIPFHGPFSPESCYKHACACQVLQRVAGDTPPPRANLPSPNPSGISSFKRKPCPSDAQSTMTSHRAEGTVASGTGGQEGGTSHRHREPRTHVTRDILTFRWTVSG